MNASPSLAALSHVRGCADAQALLQRLRSGVAQSDALLVDVLEVQATGDRERLAGFARELQKQLERTT